MSIGLFLVQLLLPSSGSSIIHLFYIVVYVIIGGIIYFSYMWNTYSMDRIFGSMLSFKFFFFVYKKK